MDTLAGTKLTAETPGEARLRSLSEKTPESAAADSAGFENELKSVISRGAEKKPVDKKLMDACVEYESILVGKMIKEMKKTVHKTEWIHGGHAEEIFEDMLYDQYALELSKNSNLGIAKMLYKELDAKKSSLSLQG
jgi:Rod binding domain-containing protein